MDNNSCTLIRRTMHVPSHGPERQKLSPVAHYSIRGYWVTHAPVQVVPQIPHQLCQFHTLNEAAKPTTAAERHAKTELNRCRATNVALCSLAPAFAPSVCPHAGCTFDVPLDHPCHLKPLEFPRVFSSFQDVRYLQRPSARLSLRYARNAASSRCATALKTCQKPAMYRTIPQLPPQALPPLCGPKI